LKSIIAMTNNLTAMIWTVYLNIRITTFNRGCICWHCLYRSWTFQQY